jgi:hypothetical protein
MLIALLNGRVSEVLANENVKTTLLRDVNLYNHRLPSAALKKQPPCTL